MPKPQKNVRFSAAAQQRLADLAHLLERDQGELLEEAIALLTEHHIRQNPRLLAALQALEDLRKK